VSPFSHRATRGESVAQAIRFRKHSFIESSANSSRRLRRTTNTEGSLRVALKLIELTGEDRLGCRTQLRVPDAYNAMSGRINADRKGVRMSHLNELVVLRRIHRWSAWFLWASLVCVPVALYGALIYAPTERVMGEVQRVFYFHVGTAFAAFLAFFLVFVAGIAYLWKKVVFWDQLAVASVEAGLVFTTIVLTTGPIWARPVWNTWFPWGDPRVTTTLVLWFIYVAYLVLRSSLPEAERKYKLCAVFGIVGFLDVPIVWMSIRWWRTIHPVVITSSGANLDPPMLHALVAAVVAAGFLIAALILLRAGMRVQARLVEVYSYRLADQRRWGP